MGKRVYWQGGIIALYSIAALIAPLVVYRISGQAHGELLPGAAPPYFKGFLILITIGISGICFFIFRSRKWGHPIELIPLFVPALVCFFVLSYLALSYQKPYDYRCYEYAAISILDGHNPYGSDELIYVYPPLTAQIMAMIYRMVELLPCGNNSYEPSGAGWDAVFYIFQGGQLFAVVLMYYLCRLLLKAASMEEPYLSILCGFVIICNFPLMNTLRMAQVNIWVLDLILFAVVFHGHHPVLAGIAAAIGGHIKLYPLVFLIPWVFKYKLKSIVSALLTFILIVYIQSDLGNNWTLWKQLFAQISRLRDYPRGHSILTAIQSSLAPIAEAGGISRPTLELTAGIICIAVVIALFAWLMVRFVYRERKFSDLTGGNADGNTDNTERLKMISHSIDALLFGLLASSAVCRHHYIFTVPAIIWGFATCCSDKKLRMAIVGFLILCVPRMYIIPLRYVPVAAILYMLYIYLFDVVCKDRFDKV